MAGSILRIRVRPRKPTSQIAQVFTITVTVLRIARAVPRVMHAEVRQHDQHHQRHQRARGQVATQADAGSSTPIFWSEDSKRRTCSRTSSR